MEVVEIKQTKKEPKAQQKKTIKNRKELRVSLDRLTEQKCNILSQGKEFIRSTFTSEIFLLDFRLVLGTTAFLPAFPPGTSAS